MSSSPTSTKIPRSKYWLKFPKFEPHYNASLASEFSRLSRHMGWSERSKKQSERRGECYLAEFEAHFGDQDNRLEVWQKMCEGVVDEIPKSINKCMKALKSARVNLVNLLDHQRNPQIAVKIFKSNKAFKNYTENGRIFPKSAAKQKVFLKRLLREVLEAYS